MKLQVLNFILLTFLGFQVQAQTCYTELSSKHAKIKKYICFSRGPFEIGDVKKITVTQNGRKIDEFEATVIEADTNYDWDGGKNCKAWGYPQSSFILVSSQINYILEWQEQWNCHSRLQGLIRPAD